MNFKVQKGIITIPLVVVISLLGGVATFYTTKSNLEKEMTDSSKEITEKVNRNEKDIAVIIEANKNFNKKLDRIEEKLDKVLGI